MRFAICDDNKVFSDILYKMLIKYQIEKNIDFEIDSFLTTEELSSSVKSKTYNLIFLDIEFPAKSGIDFAKFLRFYENNFKTDIIFISGSDQYFRELLSFQPFGFLEKPFEYFELENILETFYKSKITHKVFSYKKQNSTYIIPQDDIIYFSSSNRKIVVYSIEKNDSFYGKLDDLENDLDNKVFIRVNKSHIVNKNFIEKFSHGQVRLINGLEISITTSYKINVLKILETTLGE